MFVFPIKKIDWNIEIEYVICRPAKRCHILSFLSPRDLCQVDLTCQKGPESKHYCLGCTHVRHWLSNGSQRTYPSHFRILGTKRSGIPWRVKKKQPAYTIMDHRSNNVYDGIELPNLQVRWNILPSLILITINALSIPTTLHRPAWMDVPFLICCDFVIAIALVTAILHDFRFERQSLGKKTKKGVWTTSQWMPDCCGKDFFLVWWTYLAFRPDNVFFGSMLPNIDHQKAGKTPCLSGSRGARN